MQYWMLRCYLRGLSIDYSLTLPADSDKSPIVWKWRARGRLVHVVRPGDKGSHLPHVVLPALIRYERCRDCCLVNDSETLMHVPGWLMKLHTSSVGSYGCQGVLEAHVLSLLTS